MPSANRKPSAWGPSHQHRRPPGPRATGRYLALAVALLAIAAELIAHRLAAQGPLGALASTLRLMVRLGILVALLGLAGAFAPSVVEYVRRRRGDAFERTGARLAGAADPGGAVRAHAIANGGGAFLGRSAAGDWVAAHPEHAVLVLGPPRSGKTSAVVIPSILAAPGAVVCTSTKPDVMRTTLPARAAHGQVWVFDPTESHAELPDGARRLHWSPVAAADSWDSSLQMSRAMTAATATGAGTTNESHWRERSAALLAPLLLAANRAELAVGDVLRWVLRGELDAPAEVLDEHRQEVAGDVLAGILRTDPRERSSILSAAAGVLAAYNADSVRRAAARPDFEPDRFAASTDTIFITAPAHAQALCAPLVVGLLEQIRYAAYRRARTHAHPLPVLMCLDELANIAPIHDLPALVSEAGGQGLHVLACLQDLSQARARWGEAAEGLLSLFQTKLVLDGIGDTRTLEAISLALGEYDRNLVSHSAGRNHAETFWTRSPASLSENVSYSTARQRVLSPGDIARLPDGHALLLRGTRWELLRLAPWHSTEPWATLAADPALTPPHGRP